MNLNFRKTVLLMGACLGVGMFSPAYASSSYVAAAAVQQTKKVSGVVNDAAGPVIGATIMEKGTSNGTVTDFDGNFSLDVQPGATLVITYIGYKTQEIVVGNQSTFSILLAEDSDVLDEVVVVGYGVQKKKLVTGATLEVKGENIAKLNTTQALGALQSQAPGVNIQAASGQPGDGFKINIRGAGTNSSTNPIYVIDGVAGGDINSINPADIERIDVLKDAASAAIYGSSAANGVILITTKQGKAGKVEVSYDGNVGWQNVYKMPETLNAKQYMNIMDLVSTNSGGGLYDWSRYIDADLLAAYNNGTNKGTNWIEEFRHKNAIVTNHSMNVSGGNDISKFSMGVGYQYQDGVFGGPVKSDYRRFTFRLNSEHVIYRVGDREVLKIGENLYYQHRQSQGVQIGNQYSNDISNMLRANPCVPVYNKNGEYFMYDDIVSSGTNGWFPYNNFTSNPIAAVVYNQAGNNKSKSFNLSAIGYLEFQPIKNLVYRGQISYKQYSSSWWCYLPTFRIHDNSGGFRSTDQTTDNLSLGWNWNLVNTLNYRFDLAEKNHFDVMAGTEYSRTRPHYGESVNATASGNIFGDAIHAYMHNMTERNSAVVDGYPSGYGAKMSYFGRLNYDYNETYMFTAIFRADGSSNFAPGNQWGYFPSFSAGWVISNEGFMKNTSSWLSFLKLRAGWGQNGNDNLPTTQWKANFAFGDYGQYSFGNAKDSYTQGGYPSNMENPNLQWETSQQTNVGLDARFLGGKLTATFEWYLKETKDLLLRVPLWAIVGQNDYWANAGTVRNTGIEAALGWNDNIGEFKYGINANFARNKNKVTEVNNANKFVNGGNDLIAQNTGYMARMQEGFPIGYFYGFKTDGVIQNASDLQSYLSQNCKGDAANSLQGSNIAPGDLKFVDVNGDGVVNADDKTEIGSPHPDFTLGLSFNAAYKGFDLSVTTFGSFGNEVVRSWRKNTDSQFENYTTEVFNYWHGEGTSNKYPMLKPGNIGVNWQQVSDIYVEDATYYRIQNVTLGYDFASLLKKSSLFNQLRVYFAAQNLWTFTGYKGMDPENGSAIGGEPWVTGVDVGNYPQARTYMVGVNIKFKGKDEAKAPVAAVAPTTIKVVDNAEIDRLNGELNKLRAENDRLKNQPGPTTKTIIDEKVVTYPYFVNFEIGETEIVNRERVNLSTIAQMIKQNPGKKYNVMGYADKATGSAERNDFLAENRAKNVYDLLVKEYGVPANSLVLDSKGGVGNLYFDDPQMSRSVIISEVK